MVLFDNIFLMEPISNKSLIIKSMSSKKNSTTDRGKDWATEAQINASKSSWRQGWCIDGLNSSICVLGLKPCHNACVDTGHDPTNCGDCDRSCPPRLVCGGGICGCKLGTVSCGGVCVDLQ